MRSPDAFREFYRRELLPELRRFEAERAALRARVGATLRSPLLWGLALLGALVLRSLAPLVFPVLVGAIRAGRLHTTSRTSLKRELWSGLFFVADFNKSFQGRTLLLPDRAERLLGSFGRAFQQLPHFGLRLVELEDPDFERQFAVYANDETEARYLLSTSLMQRIVRFRENTGAALRLAFANQSLYLAMPLAMNLFELPALASLENESALHAWVGELAFLTGIIEDLDLNTRIWSKPPAA